MPPMPPGLSPPVFAELYNLGNLMQSLQNPAFNQAAGTNSLRQMEDLIRTFSQGPLFAGLPGANLPQQNPWLGAFNNSAATPPWNMNTQNAPALGIGREYQEDWRTLTGLKSDYDDALRAFGELFQDFVKRASEAFYSANTSATEQTDFSALCRKWIECCENEFQSFANTPEYSTRFGRLLNAYLRLLQHTNRMQDKLAELSGQPSRRALDALNRKGAEAQARIEVLEQKIQQLESAAKANRKRAPRGGRSTKKSTK